MYVAGSKRDGHSVTILPPHAIKETRNHSLRVETELVGEEGADLPLALVGRAHPPELLAETFGLRGGQGPLVPIS